MSIKVKDVIIAIFEELNNCIVLENEVRQESGAIYISRCEVKILGQTSLLIQPELTYILNLAQTGDLDALLQADYFVKVQLKRILATYGFVYDEDSPLIFIPEDSHFAKLLDLKMIEVLVIDVESALVSKAVKSPIKNNQLITDAIASGKFQNLVARILNNNGDLNKFK